MNVENTMKDIEGYLIDVSDEDMATLKESGITTIRLLTLDCGYPEDGQLDEAYLDGYMALLERFTDAGFWVVVDMHQIMGPTFSTSWCTGMGLS